MSIRSESTVVENADGYLQNINVKIKIWNTKIKQELLSSSYLSL